MVSPRRRSQPIYELLVWRTYEPDPLAWLPGDALLAMNGLPIIVLSLVGQIATRMHNDGFVHGDLRAADALYGKTHTGFDLLGVSRGGGTISILAIQHPVFARCRAGLSGFALA